MSYQAVHVGADSRGNGNYQKLTKSTQTSTSRPQTLQLVASQIEKCN